MHVDVSIHVHLDSRSIYQFYSGQNSCQLIALIWNEKIKQLAIIFFMLVIIDNLIFERISSLFHKRARNVLFVIFHYNFEIVE